MADKKEIVLQKCKNAIDYGEYIMDYSFYYEVIALLKEQEVKSMTLEDLDEIYEKQDTHIWPFDTPPYLWMTVNPDARLTDGFWICWRDITYLIENDSPFYVRENYGKAWLIWTGKPTQEQVRAVKWK